MKSEVLSNIFILVLLIVREGLAFARVTSTFFGYFFFF